MRSFRKFTAEGFSVFVEFLIALVRDGWTAVPIELLDDVRYSMPTKFSSIDGEKQFDNRRGALAQYLIALVGSDAALGFDRETRAWLVLLFFDQFCQLMPDGSRRLGVGQTVEKHGEKSSTLAAFVDVGIDGWDYKERIKSAISAQIFHPGVPLLYNAPLNSGGQMMLTLTSAPEFIRNPALMAFASDLYFDEKTGEVLKGYTTKDGDGSVRRLGELIFKRYSRNFYLRQCSKPELGAILMGAKDFLPLLKKLPYWPEIKAARKAIEDSL